MGRGLWGPFPKPCVAMDGGAERTGKYSQRVLERGPTSPNLLLNTPKPGSVEGLFVIQHLVQDLQEHLVSLTPGLRNTDRSVGADLAGNQLVSIGFTLVLTGNLHGLYGDGRLAHHLLDKHP